MPGDISMSKPSPPSGVPFIPPWVQRDIDFLKQQDPTIFDEPEPPALLEYHGLRLLFVATVGDVCRRVLLYDVKLHDPFDDRILIHHKWVNGGKWTLELFGGETILFAATVDHERLLRPSLKGVINGV